MGFRGHLKLYHVGSFDITRKATSSRDVKPYIKKDTYISPIVKE